MYFGSCDLFQAMSNAPPGRKGEVKQLYVHPRARSTNDPVVSTAKDSKPEQFSSKPKVTARGEQRTGEQRTGEQRAGERAAGEHTKVANSKKLSNRPTDPIGGGRGSHPSSGGGRGSHPPSGGGRGTSRNSRSNPNEYKTRSRKDNKPHPSRESKARSSNEPERTWKDIDDLVALS